jgi:thiol-disulfide isomerase/thioredoxin
MWNLVSSAQNPNSDEFVLSGIIKNSKKDIVYLSYTNKNGSKVRDSCRLQNGHFSFRGSISEPTFAILKTTSVPMPDAENKNIAAFFLEPIYMTANIVYDKFDVMVLMGSKTLDEFTALNKRRKFINENYRDSLYERHSNLSEEYIFNHRDSYISAYQLSGYRARWPRNTVQYLFMRLNDNIQNSLYGKQVKLYLDQLDANSEGRKASDFIAKDFEGKSIELSDFKGKYLLLDFWGSWCAPCRESSPHLIELFKTYSSKGFTVVGIAKEYDQTDVKWKEAIKNDGTDIWYNVLSDPLPGSPNQFTKNIAEMFGVHVFPTKLLIDPCGYIIGRFEGTNGDHKLDKQLKQIYNQPISQ